MTEKEKFENLADDYCLNDEELMKLIISVDPSAVRIPKGIRNIANRIISQKQAEIDALRKELEQMRGSVKAFTEAKFKNDKASYNQIKKLVDERDALRKELEHQKKPEQL